MLAEQLKRLQKIAQGVRLDALALVPGSNLRYLTGISFHLLERPFIIFIPAEGEPAIVVPSLEMKQLRETGFPGTYFAWTDAEGYADAFTNATEILNLAGKNIGVEGLRMRVKEGQLIQHYAPGSQIIDADEALIDLRIVKTPEEVEFHRRAVRVSEQALSQLLEELQIGMTERQIARRLSELQIELGGAGDSFSPTVLVGPRSALPHGQPGDTPLQQGDTLLIDFGTIYKGYVSDITRTFFVGEPSARARAIYETVLAANTTGREAAGPGATGNDIDTQTTEALKNAGFEDYIKHRTGHGLGIDIHEHPNISRGETRSLEPGMVFTIEPGLYVEGEVGVRIEDNIVVTEDGAESLTTFPRELKVLDL